MGTGYSGEGALNRFFDHGELTRVQSGGGFRNTYPVARQIKAKLTAVSPRQVELANARRQTISNTIIAEGPPIARVNDRLVLYTSSGASARVRYFYINSVEDPGDLGEFTIYGCFEGGESGVGTT